MHVKYSSYTASNVFLQTLLCLKYNNLNTELKLVKQQINKEIECKKSSPRNIIRNHSICKCRA